MGTPPPYPLKSHSPQELPISPFTGEPYDPAWGTIIQKGGERGLIEQWNSQLLQNCSKPALLSRPHQPSWLARLWHHVLYMWRMACFSLRPGPHIEDMARKLEVATVGKRDSHVPLVETAKSEAYRYGDRVIVTTGIYRDKLAQIRGESGERYMLAIEVGKPLSELEWMSLSEFRPWEEPQLPPQSITSDVPVVIAEDSLPKGYSALEWINATRAIHGYESLPDEPQTDHQEMQFAPSDWRRE